MLDPFMLFKLPVMAFRWMTARLGIKTVLIGMGLVTVIVCIYGCWEAQ